jgi:hypothetical protein
MGLALISALAGAVIWLVWDASLAVCSRKAGAPPVARSSWKEVTVVMCVRNGGRHVKEWMARDWDVPVVLVDDGSTDGSTEGLEVLHVEGTRPGKKDALAAGIAAARTEWVALTDVDCRPGPNWPGELLAAAGPETEVVTGVSLPVLGRVQAVPLVEAVAVARRYAAAAGAGVPYMGVGRNLAYRKSGFPGFERHAAWASGDDDLLVQDWPRKEGVKRADQIRFSAHNVPTFAPDSLRAWRRMKRRHLTTGTAYRPAVVAVLALPALAAALWIAGTTTLWTLLAQAPDPQLTETVHPAAVLHIALWIVHGAGGLAWFVHVLTFRAFATRCGLTGWAVWGGLLQPVVFFEQVVLTIQVAWATRFGLKPPPTEW